MRTALKKNAHCNFSFRFPDYISTYQSGLRSNSSKIYEHHDIVIKLKLIIRQWYFICFNFLVNFKLYAWYSN